MGEKKKHTQTLPINILSNKYESKYENFVEKLSKQH